MHGLMYQQRKTSKNPANVVYFGLQNKYIYRIDNANVGDPPLNMISNIPRNVYILRVPTFPPKAEIQIKSIEY